MYLTVVSALSPRTRQLGQPRTPRPPPHPASISSHGRVLKTMFATSVSGGFVPRTFLFVEVSGGGDGEGSGRLGLRTMKCFAVSPVQPGRGLEGSFVPFLHVKERCCDLKDKQLTGKGPAGRQTAVEVPGAGLRPFRSVELACLCSLGVGGNDSKGRSREDRQTLASCGTCGKRRIKSLWGWNRSSAFPCRLNCLEVVAWSSHLLLCGAGSGHGGDLEMLFGEASVPGQSHLNGREAGLLDVRSLVKKESQV